MQYGLVNQCSRLEQRKCTYRTREALPAVLSPERFYSSRPVPDRLLALLTLWQSQSHMTLLAIRMTPVNGKSYAVFATAEVAVSGERLSTW